MHRTVRFTPTPPLVFVLCAFGAILPTGCAPAEVAPPPREVAFEMTLLDSTFRSEGVAVADVNRDGALDVLAGEVWYEAPSWRMHEVSEPGVYDGATGYSRAFYNFSFDMNGDGWMDLVGGNMQDKPFWWYENPRGEPGHWKETISDFSNWGEAPRLIDLAGNGRATMVSSINGSGHVVWAEIPENGVGPWPLHVISGPEDPGQATYRHGLGIGDINQDGRDDVVGNKGWWEAPADRTESPWKLHPFDVIPLRCANIEVADLDGDNDLDLVTAAGHEAGVWWIEQLPGEDGEPRFARRLIDESYTQSHSAGVADLDGDGDFDIVSGKRFWAHNKTATDPGTNDAAVLYWYENTKGENGALTFKPHLINNDSGVGLQMVITDMNGDGQPDIVISNKKGVRVFFQSA